MFYIVYCIVGMPLGLLFLGNLGQFMEDCVGYVIELVKNCRQKTIPKMEERSKAEREDKEEEFEIGGLLFLALFFIYTGLGVTAVCTLLQLHVVDGIFINFSSLTAVEAEEFLSFRGFLLPISLAYLTGGLALATVAIRVLGGYLRKLRHFGEKLKNTGSTKIWFGGQSITVRNLINTLGDKLGIDQKDIDKIDLDEIIAEKLQEPTNQKKSIPKLITGITRIKKLRVIKKRIGVSKLLFEQRTNQVKELTENGVVNYNEVPETKVDVDDKDLDGVNLDNRIVDPTRSSLPSTVSPSPPPNRKDMTTSIQEQELKASNNRSQAGPNEDIISDDSMVPEAESVEKNRNQKDASFFKRTVRNLIDAVGDKLVVVQEDITKDVFQKRFAEKLRPLTSPPPVPPPTPKPKKPVNWTANKTYQRRKEQNLATIHVHHEKGQKNKSQNDPTKLLFEETNKRLKSISETEVSVGDIQQKQSPKQNGRKKMRTKK